MLGSNDFYRIAGFQLGAQRHHDVIDTRGNGFMTDIGVYGIGKVNRRRTLRQGEDFAFGRQDIDFVGEQIDFDVLKKLMAFALLACKSRMFLSHWLVWRTA